jgi:60 kDa SS-A/Ro ribonucleoprotein
MANKLLFNATRGKRAPAADTRNEAGGVAYRLSPQQTLAQYVATGCMNATFYASAETQLDTVLSLCGRVKPEFVARTALYCRGEGAMKDLPALLCASLSVLSPGLMAEVFDRVIDSPKMLRNFVQIMRSGVCARKSMGTLPKRMVRQWLEARSDEAIFVASVGRDPSLADIIRMAHPRPATKSREALYGYLLGRPHDVEALPPIVREFEAFKAGELRQAPDVPFQMLTALPLDRAAWKRIAQNASWQMTRMNLNTFARHGVFEDEAMVTLIAKRLADRKLIERARPMPHQLLMACAAASPAVPRNVLRGLQAALDVATGHVPELPGRTWVFVDVSGSMQSPVTGYRRGSSSAVRCVDVAALFAAAIVRRNPDAEVLPFHTRIEPLRINPRDSVMTTAQRLAGLPSGGTDCSIPLRELNERGSRADMVIYVSDSESWVDTIPGSWRRGTATMQEWERLKARCPDAKMICVDLQPYATVQAPDRPDILNVGGFSDAVFKAAAQFAQRGLRADHWVDVIEAVRI